MHNPKAISIKEYAARYTLVIFLVVFIASLLHYLVYSQYLQTLKEDEYKNTLKYSANSVSRTLNFYQSMVDELALQTVVIDLLQFGSNEDTQQWANNMQRLLPKSIGLALFDNNSNVKGIKGELRLSDRCIADMTDRFKNKPVPSPPVHYKIKELAHYDISSPILIDGEQIGVVFASFSLNTIKNMLSDRVKENEGIRVIAADGYIVAALGSVDRRDKGVKVYQQRIAKTDWKIELFVRNDEKNVLITSLLISNLAAFLLLSLTLYFAIKRLFNVVVSDFERLSGLMKKIKEGTYDVDEECKVSLKESQNVISFIEDTANELNNYQEQLKIESVTDELTGLLNRRALNEVIDNCLEMANKNNKIYMVILDLDKFKKTNDTYGHDVGDAVLRYFSEALVKYTKDGDICTRAGGDEFIVVLIDYEFEDVKGWFSLLSEFMFSSVKKYSIENKINIDCGISAGCTHIRNNDRKSTVFKRADNALYKIKASGGSGIECL